MQSEEQRLIDGLFSRLKETETKSGHRDQQAEQQINQYIREQPSAPYYMVQTMIIQEAALKQLDQRIKELNAQVIQLEKNTKNSKHVGGFLANFFGGSNSSKSSSHQQYQAQPQNATTSNNWQQRGQYSQPLQPTYAQPQQAATPPRADGFLGGALKTAAGIAGGVVLADMLTGMFHHSQPQEIVNIIEETSVPIDDSAMRNFEASNNLDTFNNGDGSSFLNQGHSFQNAHYQDDTDYSDDYKDDDSFI